MARNMIEVAHTLGLAMVGIISFAAIKTVSLEQSYTMNTEGFSGGIRNYTKKLDFKEMNVAMAVLDLAFKSLQEQCGGQCYVSKSGLCDPRDVYCDKTHNNYASCQNLCTRTAWKFEDPQKTCRMYCPEFRLWTQLMNDLAEKKKDFSILPSTTNLPSNDCRIWIGITILSWCITLLIGLGFAFFMYKNFKNDWRRLFCGGKDFADNADPEEGRHDGNENNDVENQQQVNDEPPARINDDGENAALLHAPEIVAEYDDRPVRQEVVPQQPVSGAEDRPVRPEVIPQQPHAEESHEARPQQPFVQEIGHETGGDVGRFVDPRQPVATPEGTCMQTNTLREGNNTRATEDNGQPAYDYLSQTA